MRSAELHSFHWLEKHSALHDCECLVLQKEELVDRSAKQRLVVGCLFVWLAYGRGLSLLSVQAHPGLFG